MHISGRMNRLERSLDEAGPSGPHVCRRCGRDQSSVCMVTVPGETPDWPRCDECPAPGSGLHLIIEDGPKPELPPPPGEK